MNIGGAEHNTYSLKTQYKLHPNILVLKAIAGEWEEKMKLLRATD